MKNNLHNRHIIITGASQGLGFEIAKRYVKEGASIAICSRSTDTLFEAQELLKKISTANQMILAKTVDISIETEVKDFISTVISSFPKIDVLVSNAGIYGPIGEIEEIDWNLWKNTFQVNLFGPVLMCKFLLPHFKKNMYGKIIQLSGGGATKPLPSLGAYAASKAAIIRFMETLSVEVKDFNIDINSVAPGALNTRLLDELIESGPLAIGEAHYQKALEQKRTGGNSFENALDLCVFLASNDSNGITGKLISALWDNWGDFMNHKDELLKSDVFTLRRIIGSDRLMVWSDK